MISNPPQPIKSIYSELYTSGDGIRQGMYVFRKKYNVDPGLLSEMLRVHQDVTTLKPNIRFWISSFTESLLRGAYNVLQLFVARSGVFRLIIKVLD